ncbi:hypothetical protein [Stutzerimonas nosocomialis]|uniref:hypothetical protein n=1 Tax=Stutzerimonas nosocomialis TaxID=1056496 RepID=UPI001F502EA3|nr:hypothetical protein [Stutzerimonas nosocomialis]
MQFEDIYRLDVVKALEQDRELDFASINDKYLQKGVCPSCGERKLFISRAKPYQLKCNRENECRYEEKTRERYSYLFENLSERFPKTEANPNATADAYLQRNRGFDTAKDEGLVQPGAAQAEGRELGGHGALPAVRRLLGTDHRCHSGGP